MRVLLLAAVAAYDPENQATYLPATYDGKADDLAAHAPVSYTHLTLPTICSV